MPNNKQPERCHCCDAPPAIVFALCGTCAKVIVAFKKAIAKARKTAGL